MPIHIDCDLDVKSKAFQDYLVDETETEYSEKFDIPDDFEYDVNNDLRGANVGSERLNEHKYAVKEIWSLQESGTTGGSKDVGLLYAHIIRKRDLVIDAQYAISYRNNLNANARNKARELFKAYDETVHGSDILAYIKGNADDLFEESDVNVQARVLVSKDGAAVDIETSQRKALLQLYGVEPRTGRDDAKAMVPPEQPLDYWAERRNFTLVKVGESSIDNGEIPTTKESVEIANPDDQQAVANEIDKALTNVIPRACGRMRREQFQLLRTWGWPEIKIIWRHFRIKIGCTSISIPYPEFWTRNAYIVIYVYYKVIEDVDQVILDILRACAKRSALAAGVLGLVTANLAVAALTFKATFKACVQNEVKECLFPGLMQVIQNDGWNRI